MADEEECLTRLPGATLETNPDGHYQPLLVLPHTKVLIQEWQLWTAAVSVIAVQVLLLLLYPFKYRTPIYWPIAFTGIVLPFVYDIYHVGSPGLLESLFFLFASHQAVFWIVTASAMILGQLWCERRFCRTEH